MCFLPAFPPKAKPAPAAPQREWEAGLAFLHSTRRELDDAGRSEQVVLALADGAYDTLNFWRGLPVIAPCWLSAPHGIDACIICPSARSS